MLVAVVCLVLNLLVFTTSVLAGPDQKTEVQGRQTSAYRPRFVFSVFLLVAFALLMPEPAFEYFHMGGQECSKPDLISGFIHLKNKQITWTQEGFSAGSTNSIGFVDYEHKVEKPPGVCRIAMLGDSMTESLQVSQESRFSNLLERRLNSLYPGRFEVFNFGVSAAGPGQDLLTYLRYVEQFRPDVTILLFESGDEDKDGRKPFMAPWHPHVVFGVQEGKLTASWRDFDSWMHSAVAMPVVLFEALRSKSHLWGALIQRFNEIKSDACFQGLCAYLDRLHLLVPIQDGLVSLLPVSSFGPSEFRKTQHEIYSERALFCASSALNCVDAPEVPIPRFNDAEFAFGREPEFHTRHLTREQKAHLDQLDRDRWELTTMILRRFAAECKRQGSILIVMGFPPLAGKEEFDSAFNRHILPLCDQKNMYATDLTPGFEIRSQKAVLSPRIATHLSVTGHQIMSGLLFDYLKRQTLLDRWTNVSSDRSQPEIKADVQTGSVLPRSDRASTPTR